MFDLGISELAVVGVVGLVVLGPERLPTVAKTAGQWIGKAQRMVQQVKSDIERETELGELKKLKEQAEGVADDIRSTLKAQTDSIKSDVESLEHDVNSAVDDIKKDVDQTGEAVETSVADPQSDYIPPVDADGYPESWYDSQPEEPAVPVGKTFSKRYRAGPSVDDLAAEIERLKAELGDRGARLGGSNRRLASRARSNRVRIYR